MKLVIQRVEKARIVDIDSKELLGKIDRGLFILIGIGKEDSETDADFLVKKLTNMRIMSDGQGKMNLSIVDIKGEVLVVSQFTLYADTSSGNRPSFINAAEPEKAKVLYEYFINKLKSSGMPVSTGKFAAHMQIEAVCDGPVTIYIES